MFLSVNVVLDAVVMIARQWAVCIVTAICFLSVVCCGTQTIVEQDRGGSDRSPSALIEDDPLDGQEPDISTDVDDLYLNVDALEMARIELVAGRNISLSAACVELESSSNASIVRLHVREAFCEPSDMPVYLCLDAFYECHASEDDSSCESISDCVQQTNLPST